MTRNTLTVDHAWLGGEELTSNVTFTIAEGRIESVEPGAAGPAVSGIALPGLVSTHSHAFHRALRGRTHRSGGDFWAWREPMYELAGRLSPESYELIAGGVFAEMLRSGITTVGEFHYVHHRPDGSRYEDENAMQIAVLNAAAKVGMRITLLDTLYLTRDVDGSPPAPEQARFSDGDSAAWATRVRNLAAAAGEGAVVGVAAHSVRAVPGDGLEVVAGVGEELDCPIHIHVSEQPAENEACFSEHGMTPIAWLDRHGFLGERTTLVHATHAGEADREIVAGSGAGVCLCPTTEADLGDGIGPAAEYASRDVPISLGSDSNAVIDILEEARRVEHHDRLRLGRRGIHSPADLLSMATSAGARALGRSSGRLEPGADADIIIVDPDHLDLAGVDPAQGLASLVMGATRAAVTHVLVGGVTLLSPAGSSLPTEHDIAEAVRMAWS